MEDLKKCILKYGKKKELNQLMKALIHQDITNELYNYAIQFHQERIDASNDEAHSHFELGYIYQHGLGNISKDVNQAFNHYSRAAKLNHPSAQFHICQLCCSQDEVNRDNYAFYTDKAQLIELRIRMYIASAAQGDAYSDADRYLWSNYNRIPQWQQKIQSYYSLLCQQVKLIQDEGLEAYQYYSEDQHHFEKIKCNQQQYYGRIYNQLGYLTFKLNFYGDKSLDEYAKARKYFEKAGEYHDCSAYFNLARWYYNLIHGIQSDKSAYNRYLLLAAKHEHALAQHEVAVTLGQNGNITNGVGQCYDFLTRSCRYSFARTCYDLAIVYIRGFGVECDYDIAIHYLNQAIVSRDFRMGDGLSKASIALALIYKNGIGCHVNMVRACHFLANAVQRNEEPLFYCHLGKVAKKITQRKEIAAMLYKQAMPCPYAYYLMGKLYQGKSKGRLFQTSKTQKYFQLAIDNLSVYAIQHYHLGIMYQYGLGTETNRQKADNYFKKQMESASQSLDYYVVYLGQKADLHYGVRSLVMVVSDSSETITKENLDELML